MKCKRIVITSLLVLIALFIISVTVFYFISASVYDDNFGYRCTTSREENFSIGAFREMKRSRYTFESNKGQQLVGYLYEPKSEDVEIKGVIVFSHGLGAGGQRGYMKVYDQLCKDGYYVFAYDATGNDESEGDVIGGLPQGIADADHAIDFVHTIERLSNMPVMLMGYSWGAMSVSNVIKYHPEVVAVASLSGWDRSIDMIAHEGREVAGDAVSYMLPFVSLHELLKYGKYASCSAMDAFDSSDCKVMIVHGEDDGVVPIELGYDKYYEKYSNDERFVFLKYENRGHDIMKTGSGQVDSNLISRIIEFFDESIK